MVVGSRANYARIKSVLLAIKTSSKLELILVLNSSALLDRYGSIKKIVKKDGFKIHYEIFNMFEGNNLVTMTKSVAAAISELSTIFYQSKPNFVLTVADRFETMATAIAASYMNILLVHTQGGEVTGSIDESVRHSISKLAHIHFTTTKQSTKNLIQMGENKKYIFQTGCPSFDFIKSTLNQKYDLNKLLKKYGGVGLPLDLNDKYIICLFHPVTTEIESVNYQVNVLLDSLCNTKLQVIWLWPNIDAGADNISKVLRKFHNKNKRYPISFYKNFSPEDYIVFLDNAELIIGNSSSGIREASFLGVPSINIGSRQNGREKSLNVVDVGFDKATISKEINRQLSKKYKPNFLYGDGKTAKRIVKVLETTKPSIQKRFIRLDIEK